jgi:hypothetical protein
MPERMWLVHQNSFAYLNGQDTGKVLGTASEFVCIEIKLKGRAVVLVHLDPGVDHFKVLTDVVSYLTNNGINSPEYEQAQILTNVFSSRLAIRRAFYTLKLMGMTPEVVRCLPPLKNDIIVNREGEIFRTNMATGFARTNVPEEEKIRMAREMFGAMGKLRSITCINNKETVSGETSFEIYPGIRFLDIRDWQDGGNKRRFVIHAKIEDGIDEKTIEKVPRLEGVKFGIDNCSHGRYLTVGTRTRDYLNPEFVKNVETTAMNIMAVVFQSRE